MRFESSHQKMKRKKERKKMGNHCVFFSNWELNLRHENELWREDFEGNLKFLSIFSVNSWFKGKKLLKIY